MKKVSRSKANGSSYKGSIHTTYNKLVEAFGPPNAGPSADGKIKIEWVLQDKKKQIITIYDWKTEQAPLPDEVYGWHIGGHTGSVVETVYNKIDP
jgi:hypothetical protein